MTQTREEFPTFKLWRPVLNLSPEIMGHIIQAADDANVPTPKSTRTHLEASILGAGELTTFHFGIGAEPNGDEIWDICEYVHEGLPDSADDYLTVPVFPAIVRPANTRPERRSIAIAPDNPVTLDESYYAYELLAEYHGLSSTEQQHRPSPPAVNIGKFGHDPHGRKSKAFTEFLYHHSELLASEHLLLGPVWAETMNDD